MKDFYEQFKENLENRPEPLHEERLWNRLDRDLDNLGKKNRYGGGWWWMLGAFCFLLLGSNLFTMFELQKVNQQINSLEQKTDTVYLTNIETKTVYLTDTIVQTKTIQQEIIRYVASSIQNNFSRRLEDHQLNEAFWSTGKSGMQTEGAPYPDLFTYSDLLTKHIHNKNNKNTKSISSKDLASKNNNIIHFTSLNGLPLLDIDALDNQLTFGTKPTLYFLESRKRKTVRQQLYAMRPKSFQFGISGGYANLLNKDLEESAGFSASLNTAVIFSPKLQLWINAAYIKADVISTTFNSTTPGPLTDPPITNDFQFTVAEANPAFLQYSVGLQYFLNADKKWRPFVGLGYVAESLRPYNLTYEFSVPMNPGLEWSTKERFGERTISNMLLLRAGLEYQLTSHWNWQIKVDYRRDFRKQNKFAPNLINLQTGLNYTF